MIIELKFTNEEARRARYFLRKKYNSKANLKKLIRVAIVLAVSEQAQKELDELGNKILEGIE